MKDNASNPSGRATARSGVPRAVTSLVVAVIAIGVLWYWISHRASAADSASAHTPEVEVSHPLERSLPVTLGFLGQFSAVNQVEIRAQVGGTLEDIHFKDGDVVHKGDLLFVIDPVPYQIRLAQAHAQLENANARLNLANRELTRAETLKRGEAGTEENVEQRAAEQLSAQAAVDDAKAQIRDAEFDLDHCRITAPFSGRMGTHLVSVGNLIAGSRAATSPTTLLATLVSLDPIYLDFDMSEADYGEFSHERTGQAGPLADKIRLALADETTYSRSGTLDFIDNALNRSSGTIHARATVSNPDLTLTPGEFARVRLELSEPSKTLLVPDDAVLPDQSEHLVLTTAADGTVVPKHVELGDMHGGLRIIRSGLTDTDNVIVDGLPYAAPGSKVTAHARSLQFVSSPDGE
jgi:membrane fusion protein, multidrug efflux system